MRYVALAVAVLSFVSSASAWAGPIQGNYLEARTADIYTGPCFSNSEVFITGHQALMAWQVQSGEWNGVDLSGLTVAAAVRGTTTFSEDQPTKAQAVLIVDEKATSSQRDALIAMAQSLGGDRLKHIVGVKASPMSLTVEQASSHGHGASAVKAAAHHETPQAPRASFYAPGLAEIMTRPLNANDCVCGNEVVAYPPLSRGTKVLPAYTLGNAFRSHELGTRWDDPNCRSSFVGTFSSESRPVVAIEPTQE